MHDHTKYLAAAHKAVTQAAIVCNRVQGDLERVRSITKDDKSPVTVADFASQAIVGRILLEELGRGVKLVAEEDSAALREPEREAHLAAVVEAVRLIWPDATEADVLDAIDVGDAEPAPGGFWTLDPIDGTKGFLRGQQYAVSLGFIEGDHPVVGALACPNLAVDQNAPVDKADARGSIYLAIRGKGCFETPCGLCDTDQEPRAIRRGEPDAPVRVCASVEKAHSSVSDTDRVLEKLANPGEPVRLDSQAKYAVVARGQADAYLRLPTKKDYVERIWDHAAGSLIATEAGCRVSDIHAKPLDFSRGKGLEKNSGIVCATPEVHAKLIEAIRELALDR